jgi:polyribonucleotide nucleotidyltransferase
MAIKQVSKVFTDTTKKLSFETGKLALQADGAVLAQMGETVLLVTATASKEPREGTDFFPLTVDIEERMYAAGKIPGSFFRREGRASDQAILTARLIDRPLRPCFAEGLRNEVQIIGTIMGADLENPHDVLAINAASAALMISGIPFNGPVGAVRLAYCKDGKWIAHPTFNEIEESSFDIVVAGKKSGDDIAIIMVEAGAGENSFKNYEKGAPKVDEKTLAEGLELSKRWIKETIELQLELAAVGSRENTKNFGIVKAYDDDVYEKVEAAISSDAETAIKIASKVDRNKAFDALEQLAIDKLADSLENRADQIKPAVKAIIKKLIRKRIVEEKLRIDGRGVKDIRPLSAEVGLIPTAHGSALFQRGETQVLNVTTLGMPRMNQLLDSITLDESKRYMHHYNFPPFSTGETAPMRGPKRREIGHGLLAERALLSVIPHQDEFPYTLRLVSEVLSSNGSTSMASVCASTLSLMDAGVPIKEPVAGIAMGLINEGDNYITLTDILGDEDAYGDMDFKVAGTKDAVTALQLDTKIDGIPSGVLEKALEQAKEARLIILDVIVSTISAPRKETNKRAPKVHTMEIDPEKIGEIIGPKGKNINAIQQETGCEINIDETAAGARLTVGAKDQDALNLALKRIEDILHPPTPEIGKNYKGKVVSITKFGAFVNILPNRDGLLHISKVDLSGSKSKRLEDVLSVGDELDVLIDSIDSDGRISLIYATKRKPEKPQEFDTVSFEDQFESELEKEIGTMPEIFKEKRGK